MRPEARLLRRRALGAVVLPLAHVVLVYGLDAVGLVEALLSPGGALALVAFPLALLLYAVRFALLFLMPGVLVATAVFWAAAVLKERLSGPTREADVRRELAP